MAEEKKYKFLIAEDDEISQELLSIVLRSVSNELLIAGNGKEAVELSRMHPDIDVILMDIQMPVMNGYEATAEIRKENKEVIIIAQTAFALSDYEDRALKAGCNAYLTKPINKDKLLDLISNLQH